MAAHFLKRQVNHLGYSGSAIIYWHEAQGCPPSVKALPLHDIESLEPGNRISEKTLCNARYKDQIYKCVVLWIEEDKSPDELTVARLLPSSNERIFEEKGMRWARELQYNGLAKGRSELIGVKAELVEGPDAREQSISQNQAERNMRNGDEIECEDDQKRYSGELELNFNGIDHDEPVDHDANSPAYESSAASASSSTYTSHARAHISNSINDMGIKMQKQGRKQKIPTKACSMVQMMPSVPRMNIPSSIRSQSPMMDDLDDDMDDFDDMPSLTAADTTSLALSSDGLVKRMLLETTWTKALRCAMRELFTEDELATSLPHQSKSGMNVLDPHRLAVAKDLLAKYCSSKDVPQPSRRHVSQALHNCLISSRTSKFRMKKFSHGPKFNFNHSGMPQKVAKFRDMDLPRQLN
ncbi:uncharacterized protein LOC129594531 [Paramacrobiotus metropolitanus]|uniref:uncharacterized protein LOC129594531 n=1 Tax=Paramacrobiotus metropolitanus TaxID=2943436 RepID=UPI0024460E8B|nr:uncharacterized protein LOC129594531 [Paramacrobiotus metropolitanus]XP_055347217.1 uncharacterized protein LOC129594531 [Paramacrobiotus metropolitanus]XP_055347218.1 uncharacterized protein LOC129594531 [Paramacrobiotus metropolitanus]